MNNKQEQGFTLIELLIVVAIIAILAAIAIPNFLQAEIRAKVARAHSEIQTLFTATEAYEVDNNTYPMTNGWFPGSNITINGGIPDRNGSYECYFGNYPPNVNVPASPYLTTPISYIASIPMDPFNGPTPRTYAYYSEPGTPNSDPGLQDAMWYQWYSVGPDGLWDSDPLINKLIFEGRSMEYDPSNGTVSNGDIQVVGGELEASQLDVY